MNKYKNTCSKTSSFLFRNNIKHCFLNPTQIRINLHNLINDEIYRDKINNEVDWLNEAGHKIVFDEYICSNDTLMNILKNG